MLQIFIVSFLLVGLAIIGLAVRMFLVKGGTFKKECSCGKNDNRQSCSNSCETETEEIH